ncbi:hypothetical protein BGZ97_002832 [Linnemannia gamsii]|uniref:F-box domain-containing protein n=1 Tax=Linnemannia gamsii TaxID=64522 RepID=A0A9P6QWK1_9FUNG|nr:hypothetical protein BGZ97_002832 [Linnemannia gamsii]
MTDQLSNLPLEVLQCILQTIADNNDCQSLFSLIQLLRVNRYFALVTVPYIYSNPFYGLASYAEKNVKYREIVRNFLSDDVFLAGGGSCGGGGELPKNVVWEFKPYLDFPSFPSTECDTNSSNSDTNGNNDNSSGMTLQPRPRPLNYLAHLRHLDFTMDMFTQDILRKRYQLTEEDLAYIEGGKYMSHHRYLTSNDNHNGSDSDINSPRLRHGRSDKKKVAWDMYETTVYQDTTWALAIPLLDRLESLTFPVSDMQRWIGVIGRLGRLETLEFVIDADNLDMNNNNSSSGSPSDNEQQPRSREHETIQSMIYFIKIHTGVFPGRLKTVNTSGRRSYQYFDPDWLADLQTQISRLLPPMDRPKALNSDNWARLLAHPEATNLGFVEDIIVEGGMWRDRNVEGFDEYTRFLERCRVLKRLDLRTPLGKGSFQWAVLEKKRALGGRGDLVTLVPLERVDILGYNLSTDEADAIAFAFSNTLQHLTIETTREVEGPWPTIINIGRGQPGGYHDIVRMSGYYAYSAGAFGEGEGVGFGRVAGVDFSSGDACVGNRVEAFEGLCLGPPAAKVVYPAD